MITPARNAAVKPSTSATSSAAPEATASLVCEVAMVEERGDAERAADLLRGVDQPGGQARLGRLHARERGDRDRHEREADADADQQEAGQEVAEVRAADGDLRGST